jgi:hypothetical protein
MPAALLGPALAAATGMPRARDALETLGDLSRTAQRLGPFAGAVALVAGAVLLVLLGRYRRPVAAVGGALVGALAALLARGPIAAHLGLSLPVSAAVLAAAGAAGAFAFPVAFPFAAGAVPGAALGYGVPLAGRALLGAAAGGVLAGAVALLFARPVAIGFVSISGGLLAAVGAVALLRGTAFAAEVTAHPAALAAVALVVGIAGAAYQLERREAPRAEPGPMVRDDPP